jgi:hypothetical protein
MVEMAGPEMVQEAQEMAPATILAIHQTLAQQFIRSAKTQPIVSPLLVSDCWPSALQLPASAHP